MYPYVSESRKGLFDYHEFLFCQGIKGHLATGLMDNFCDCLGFPLEEILPAFLVTAHVDNYTGYVLIMMTML